MKSDFLRNFSLKFNWDTCCGNYFFRCTKHEAKYKCYLQTEFKANSREIIALTPIVLSMNCFSKMIFEIEKSFFVTFYARATMIFNRVNASFSLSNEISCRRIRYCLKLLETEYCRRFTSNDLMQFKKETMRLIMETAHVELQFMKHKDLICNIEAYKKSSGKGSKLRNHQAIGKGWKKCLTCKFVNKS